MATTTNNVQQAYADPGQAEHERAVEHREQALHAVECEQMNDALMHALLAVEGRIEELTVYVARLS